MLNNYRYYARLLATGSQANQPVGAQNFQALLRRDTKIAKFPIQISPNHP
jgi:hypothetical protein